MKKLDTVCHKTQLFHSFLFILLVWQQKKVWVFFFLCLGLTFPSKMWSKLFHSISVVSSWILCKVGYEFGFRFCNYHWKYNFKCYLFLSQTYIIKTPPIHKLQSESTNLHSEQCMRKKQKVLLQLDAQSDSSEHSDLLVKIRGQIVYLTVLYAHCYI